MFSIKEYDTIFANFSDLLVIHRKFLQVCYYCQHRLKQNKTKQKNHP